MDTCTYEAEEGLFARHLVREFGEAGGLPLFKEARTRRTALGHPLLEARVTYRPKRRLQQFGGYPKLEGCDYLTPALRNFL